MVLLFQVIRHQRIMERMHQRRDLNGLRLRMVKESFTHDEAQPKFHCELSWIENVWGDMKRFTPANCSYSITALRETLPEAIQYVNSAEGLVRNKCYQRRCFRLIDAYHKGNSLALAAFAAKKYKSHRMIPTEAVLSEIVLSEIHREFEAVYD
ncbi:hypothetical protein BCR33DRAFT_813206 [Rhizoclosmatium globosum]|uniref:Uncharacterized protein n=1 Tax=Rhizoclosmatium globosum TaxID=329046 RepID=A0A1Y2AJX5_9FUNG|nr:hypothetical protein BCR33DRAFT_813206 [Rhizoclosmatium globosum]|eukprot:ORY22255.1 hypothetical protein BCR33DRAFT_813206 [Rhizoclosmatium globosum]